MEGDLQNVDLVISVRVGTGQMGERTIDGGPLDKAPVVLQPGAGDTRVGIQQGRPPRNDPSYDPNTGQRDTNSQIGRQVGSENDSFAVFIAMSQSPRDSPIAPAIHIRYLAW